MRAASSSSDRTIRPPSWVGICATGALLALACASERPPAPESAPPPRASAPSPGAAEAPRPAATSGGEKTAADPALQRDVTKLIDQCERTLGAAGQVVDTAFERVDQQTVVESWIVGRVGGEVVYQVKLTPGADGVAVWVQCPPSPRVK